MEDTNIMYVYNYAGVWIYVQLVVHVHIPAGSVNVDCFIRVFHQPFSSIIMLVLLNPSTDHEMSNSNRCTIPLISSHNEIMEGCNEYDIT